MACGSEPGGERTCAAFWRAALPVGLGLVLFSQTALAAPARLPPRPAQAPSFARACTIALPETKPLFAGEPTEPAVSSEEADDDSDDEEDDDDDPPQRGLVLPGSATCLSITGTVSAGMQRDSFRASRLGPPPPSDATSFSVSAAFRIATSHELSSGLRIGTAFGFTMYSPVDGVSENSIDEATILIGPWTFGLDASRFSFWTGDEFIFSTRVPSRTVGVIALELPLTESWTATLALEDPALGNAAATAPVGTGRRIPDAVGRLVYAQDGWTVHGALALREIAGTPSRFGRAGILGATYEGEAFGHGWSLTAQLAGAIDGAPYIGSQLDARTVNRVLLASDATRGFSGVVSGRFEWTEELASNAYLSRYWLEVPLANQIRGEIRIDRVAANLVWTPVEGFKAGIESSVAWAKIALTGREIAAGLAGRQISTQVFIERSF
ncbi:MULTISPECIES: hypothetical protein [unclassified Bosea (in: a-proteobacteria)]|uniref:hypothetical protein n=1 Tax=unclassified Bosea (in: a-proteobacteria) TaxID=2653178 RepID=UPI000F757FD1|nr:MULTISPECIES: hypothetical protein [unclassified Bosea (in: a-proteobacteria)]AZO76847.1 hypothetical protein BLM15_03875 [Bosea sp. Tri-49]RXT21680.1 hypothetical protein B5U98_14495 [Bosea sp. Tri-39]RXT32020.1 hypothetical protein B5U99_25340 [Bosea sp. Tri-54]